MRIASPVSIPTTSATPSQRSTRERPDSRDRLVSPRSQPRDGASSGESSPAGGAGAADAVVSLQVVMGHLYPLEQAGSPAAEAACCGNGRNAFSGRHNKWQPRPEKAYVGKG